MSHRDDTNGAQQPRCRADGKGGIPTDFGPVQISAIDSVFALDAPSALLLMTGNEPADAMLEQIDWNGQGSLLTPAVQMAAWRLDTRQPPHALAEDHLHVSGLVRSQVEFVADATRSAAAGEIRRWQAPLRSSEPPGVAVGHLVLPAVRPLTP